MSDKNVLMKPTDDLSALHRSADTLEVAGQTLSRSAERLRLALDAGRMGVWEVDETTGLGSMDEINAALLGFPPDTREVTVRDFLAKVHPEDRSEIERRVAEAKITGKDYTGEYRIALPNGAVRWIASRGRFVYSPEGKPLRLVGVKHDITERKQAELAMQSWRQTFERSEFAIALGDRDGTTLITVNPAFARMHGWTVEELTGKPVPAVFAPEEHQRVRRYVEAANASSHYTWESKHIRKDGTVFPVQIDTTPIRDEAGKVIFRAAYVQDISRRKLAEVKLRESEQRFRAIFDGTFEFIGLLKPDGTLMEANQTALEYVGAPAAEVVGRPFWDTPWWSGSSVQQERLKTAIAEAAQGKFVRFEAQHPSKDGQIDYIDFSLRPITDSTGRVTMIVPEGRRITERKRMEQALRESEERLTQAVLAAEIGIYERDHRTGQLYWSPTLRQIYGLDANEPVSLQQAVDLLHPEERDLVLSAIQQAHDPAGDGFYCVERRVVRRDGSMGWVYVRSQTYFGGLGMARHPVRTVGAVVDITEHKRLESELHKRVEQLGEADRRKDEFLATLAHELRNPLAPIRNVINLLEKKGALEPDVQRARDVISRQINHFTRLIDDLLDVSRITRDKLELRKQRATLSEVIDAAMELSRPLVERNEHQLSVSLPSDPIYLDADTVRLAQVFMNLLNNAAKYTPKGGRITLGAECEGDHVTVQIADNGIGIAAEQLSRLFDMFYQADRTYEESQGGLGIGLTLVQRLVQMHGGTVEAHSAGRNQGSEFVVRLPVLSEPAAGQSESAAVDGATGAARRILVVDDYGDSADTLAELLGFDGNDVRVAHDGLEALTIAKEFRPQVALLDLGMPKLNGFETASRIREQPWGKQMHLIAVTGWGQEDVMERSKEAGFDAHILKPVDYTTLSKLLANI